MNNILRPLAFWHEDQGPALFWRAPVSEPPYAGTPLDSDWPFKPDDVVVWLPCPEPIDVDVEAPRPAENATGGRRVKEVMTIVVDTENTDITHAAYWLVIDPKERGAGAVLGGPFFSRYDAEAYKRNLWHRTGVQVMGFPGRGPYREVWERTEKLRAETDKLRKPRKP
jgi:hypothetical protein